MTEPTDPDPIELLRRSNPVEAERLPSASLARIRARVQEKVMTDTQPGAGPDLPTRRRRLTIGLAGVAAAAAIALLAFRPGGFAPTGSAPSASPSDGGGGAAGGLAMCIRFDLETLAQQEFAFDGTVTAIDGESVTFAVGNWYRGPGDASVTYAVPGLGDGVNTTETLVAFEVGGRYLVSGGAGIVWGCGYSQAYDDAAAADWAAAFSS